MTVPESSAALNGRSQWNGLDALARDLVRTLDEVGAHTGAVYLLTPDTQVLELAVMKGLPREFVRPWERVSLSTPIPVTDAVREGRLVWVSGEEEMVRRYPSTLTRWN